jgi:HPt (histidine-containing phosphotransfer) domain-containing protein
VIVADLTAVALTGLVMVLVAYLHTAGRPKGTTAKTAADETPGAQGQARSTGRGAALPALPARDLDDALRVTGGSLDIAESLLAQMLADLPAQVDILTTDTAGGDWGAARRAADSIRGATAACAVPALHAAVCRLQAAVYSEDADAIAAVVADVERERHRLIGMAQNPVPTSALAQASAP